ncbi:MAG: class I SAM-dependent methyltransferase [Chloroflexota bacterium]|nr:class I SAM-dependent methyltransferase [Chloroflexota bacterium]
MSDPSEAPNANGHPSPAVDRYLTRYLQRAPAALALWRSIEARHFGSVPMARPILDVGSGFGEFGRAFFDERCDVGLDISRRDLEICRDADVYRTLAQGDARCLPFDEAAFSTVMSVSVLEHIPDVLPFFAEAYRILKPGGTLVFSVPLVDMDAYMAFPPLARKVGLGAAADGYVKRVHQSFKHINLHEPEWWLSPVRDAGFTIEQERRIISRAATRAFDIGLPTAMLSQVGRLTRGRRAVWHPKPVVHAWAKVLRGMVEREERPGDGSNLFVVARR